MMNNYLIIYAHMKILSHLVWYLVFYFDFFNLLNCRSIYIPINIAAS